MSINSSKNNTHSRHSMVSCTVNQDRLVDIIKFITQNQVKAQMTMKRETMKVNQSKELKMLLKDSDIKQVPYDLKKKDETVDQSSYYREGRRATILKFLEKEGEDDLSAVDPAALAGALNWQDYEESEEEEEEERQYEFPKDDFLYFAENIDKNAPSKLQKQIPGQDPNKILKKPFQLKSNMMNYLIVCILLKDKIKHLTDIAFEAGDLDHSGELDAEEVQTFMEKVANNMKVCPPTLQDVYKILLVIDENSDGSVDKKEFLQLIMHGFGNILVLEEQLQEKVNMQSKEQYYDYLQQIDEERKRMQEESKFDFLKKNKNQK